MSDIMKQMAERLFRNPEAVTQFNGTQRAAEVQTIVDAESAVASLNESMRNMWQIG